MIKAVFIDYMGTLVSETSPYTEKVIGRCFMNSGAKSPGEVAKFWFGKHDELLAGSNAPNYQSEYDISVKTFEIAMEHYGFTDDAHDMCAMLEQHWVNAPAFEDTAVFFESCPVPVYVVTSTDSNYVEAAMRNLKLCPTGIISSEMAQYYKPRKEIFEFALHTAGCIADEVVHIGDSVYADVQGARNAGITPWLLDREGRPAVLGVKMIRSLYEAIDELRLLNALGDEI